MNIVHIVIESDNDKVLLEKLLADSHVIDIRFHSAGGKNATHSLARTLQVQYKEPVALVLDADSYNLEAAADDQAMYESYLRLTSYGLPFIVIMFVPSIEAIFFKEPNILETLLGQPLTSEDLIRSEYVPKTVLDKCLQDTKLNFSELVSRLSEQDIQTLSHESITKLESFIQDLAERQVAL